MYLLNSKSDKVLTPENKHMVYKQNSVDWVSVYMVPPEYQ